MRRLLCRLRQRTSQRSQRPAPAAPPSDWGLPDDYLKIECEQIARHRMAVGVDPDIPITEVPGLAISGGGIRSAVFSLGILQALADRGSLRQFSYLSSVSGGTYLTAFYASLFIPDAMRQGAPVQPDIAFINSAQTAEERLRPKTPPLNPGEVTPIEYLRDNCNYLIPNGLDDALQSVVFSTRNWFALQYVIGVSILTLVLWLNLVEMLPWWRSLGVLNDGNSDEGWRVPIALAALIAALILSPLSRAYWLTQNLAQDTRRTYQALPWISLILVDLVALGTLTSLGARLWPPSFLWDAPKNIVISGAWLVITTQLFSIIYYIIAWYYVSWHKNPGKQSFRGSMAMTSRASDSRPFVDRLRNALTNAYTTPLRLGGKAFFAGPAQMLIYVAAITLVDGMGATLHSWAEGHSTWLAAHPKPNGRFLLPSMAGAGAVIWIVSKFLLSRGDKIESAVKRIPRIILASGAAVIAALLTLAFWSTVAHFIASGLATFTHDLSWWSELKDADAWRAEFALACACVLFLLLSIVDGLCIQFLNLSTYQRLYSTRLTRTFLGASNRARLSDASERDVTSLVAGDSVSMGQYYHEQSRAPVHLINTTINKTIDWNSSLVHRGARGLSLSLGPAGMTIGAKLGVLACPWKLADDISTPAHYIRGQLTTSNIWVESLTVGDWIAISGAAVSTGLGRMTRPGYSLLLGLSNIRLGYWWNTYSAPLRGGARRRARIPIPTSSEPEHFFRETLFGTQFCLKSELLGEFDGPRARRWYLTDGGHFENTGAYELLRRQLEFIVILDNGADPELTFGDIANLIRLVRVDFGIEITVSSEPPRQPKALRIDFADVARSFHEFAERTECIGVRLITTFPNGKQGQILVIKPRLTAQAPHDVWEYQQDVPSFPQESTADQFFDDVQWESHRALGESQAKRLFPHSVRRGA